MLVLGVLLAYIFMPGTEERTTSSEKPGIGARQDERKGASARHAGIPAEEGGANAEGNVEAAGRLPLTTEGNRASALYPRRNLPPPDPATARQLMAELSQRKPHQGKLASEELDEISRLIRELRREGRMAVPAIREFLESGQDVSFADVVGTTPYAYSSLRMAMIDVLGQIGGPEAIQYMAAMLPNSTNPEEIAYLARGLELSDPGAHRSDIMNVVLSKMEQTLKNPSGRYGGMAHLFGVIQDYGDAGIAPDLEIMYRNSPSASGEFALMALSKLPEGNGVPTLVKIVNEMAGNPGAYGTRYDVALRMLAQASRDYPEAGEALLALASSNRLGAPSVGVVAATLGGTEHQLITKSSSVSKESRAEIFINGRAPETWSNAEIDQRLALIERLAPYYPQPSAAKALEEARSRLLMWRGRPWVSGKRLKM